MARLLRVNLVESFKAYVHITLAFKMLPIVLSMLFVYVVYPEQKRVGILHIGTRENFYKELMRGLD